MHVFVISFIVVCVSSLQNTEYDIVPEGIIVANIKKRDVIPLQSGNRRLLDSKNLNYRRTKDIRETSVDRRFEVFNLLLFHFINKSSCCRHVFTDLEKIAGTNSARRKGFETRIIIISVNTVELKLLKNRDIFKYRFKI